MISACARTAAAMAVRAYLAEIAAVYLGKVYNIKTDALSRQLWELALDMRRPVSVQPSPWFFAPSGARERD